MDAAVARADEGHGLLVGRSRGRRCRGVPCQQGGRHPGPGEAAAPSLGGEHPERRARTSVGKRASERLRFRASDLRLSKNLSLMYDYLIF